MLRDKGHFVWFRQQSDRFEVEERRSKAKRNEEEEGESWPSRAQTSEMVPDGCAICARAP